MNKHSILALVVIGVTMATLCNMSICGITSGSWSPENATATSEAIAQTLSTIEAETQPTIVAAQVANPEFVATAIADATRTATMATRVAPTVEAILTVVPTDAFPSEISHYDLELTMAYYETLVLGIGPKKSGEAFIDFPAFVRERVESALMWTNETYEDVFVNGIGYLGFGFRDDRDIITDDICESSLGAFVFRSAEPFPTDVDSALGLIREAYPGLRDIELTYQPGEASTFNFESRAMHPCIVDGRATLVPQVIYTGVSHRTQRDQVVVWVVVARGTMVGIWDRVS